MAVVVLGVLVAVGLFILIYYIEGLKTQLESETSLNNYLTERISNVTRQNKLLQKEVEELSKPKPRGRKPGSKNKKTTT